MFIEEFTTERCGNCPTAAGYFHEILQNPIYNNKVSMVCHHSGYYTDWLTTDFDEDYMFLYNSDSSYAPAAMLDRTRYADTQSAVFFPENIEFIQDLIDLQLKMPASANIIPSCKLADDNKSVEVTVTGNRVNHTVLEGINITVYLVENEIPAKKQSGAGVGYMQQHVNRLVNSAWGVPVEWDENTFRYNCRFDLNSEWELKNMYVVAILNWYDASNPLKCQVENSGQSLLIPSETSVDNIDIHHEITGIYDVSGMQRSKIGKGVNIVQYSDGSIKKIIK